MAKAISNIRKKRGRGRPRVDATPIMVRIAPNLLAPLDRWIAEQPGKAEERPSRPDAIRTALEDWLTGLGMMPADKPKRGSKRNG
jgi:hypothetical protein